MHADSLNIMLKIELAQEAGMPNISQKRTCKNKLCGCSDRINHYQVVVFCQDGVVYFHSASLVIECSWYEYKKCMIFNSIVA